MLVLGIGSNVADREMYLRLAVVALRSHFTVKKTSPIYESDALLPEGAPQAWDTPYLNMAVACETSGSPDDVLQCLKLIEKNIGREAGGRWGPRVIDIDILAWGDTVCDLPHLKIPHVGLAERPFALWPLADLTPDWTFPVSGLHYGKTARNLCTAWGSRFAKKAPFKTHQINASIDSAQLVAAINITPDSFSDGGEYVDVNKAIARIDQCLAEGATVIDIGAESTRPGATLISAEEEWSRLAPVLAAIKERCDIPVLSIDTRKASVAKKALSYGVKCLNDVGGFDDPAMRELAAHSDVDIVVMHHLGVPANKDEVIALCESPVSVVYTWGLEKIKQLEAAGIDRSRIIFDVGIGFGKNAEQSACLLKNISVFHELGVRLFVGHSRKSFLNLITDLSFAERDLETAVISTHLAKHGVHYIRIHNVGVNQRALNAAKAIS